MPLPAGTRLGAYQVLTPFGEGGMGEVYRARDTRLDRTVYRRDDLLLAVRALLCAGARPIP